VPDTLRAAIVHIFRFRVRASLCFGSA
jgi:hypothetical protein